MRVLWLSHLIPYPPQAGVHQRSYYLLRSVARKHDVDLIAFVQEPWLKVFYGSRTEGIEDCKNHLMELCRSVRFLDIDRLKRPGGKWRTALEGLIYPEAYTLRWLQSDKAWRVIVDAATNNSYDLAHFDTVSLAPFHSAFEDIPSTLGHHNIESHRLLRRAETEENWLKRLYFLQEGWRVGRYEARVCDSFAANITCSELDNERLRSVAKAPSVAIPNGVDVDFFRPIPGTTSTRSLVFVGSLNWYPNVDAASFILRDLWPLIKPRIPDLRLDIIGSAPPPSIRDLAASLQDVKVHGFLDDVRPLTAAASIFVCPVRDGGGTKLKLLNAFAMGKCVVAHPIACEGIDVDSGRNVILAESVAEFAEAIEEMMNDEASRNRIGNAARQLVAERYSVESIGDQLCGLFESLAAQKTSR